MATRTRPTAADAHRAATVLPTPAGAAPYPTRRRPKLILAGLALIVVFGWAAATLYLQAGDRKEVVAVARDVPAFKTLERDDLTTVRVAADPGVEVVAASRLDTLVGRVAAVRLTPNALLADQQLLSEDAVAVPAGQAVAGGLIPSGSAPIDLAAGQSVQIVLRPERGVAGSPEVIDGWVLEVGDELSGGDRPVSVVVAADHAQVVSAAAADKRMSLVVRGG